MSVAVSTIVALHGLTSKLVESCQDRKLAAELRDVHKLVIAQQSEHFALQSKCLELESERSALHQQLAFLQRDIADANKQRLEYEKQIGELAVEVQRLSPGDDVKYTMKWGCVKFANDEKLYCPSCFVGKGKKSPTSRKSQLTRFCAVCKTDIPG